MENEKQKISPKQLVYPTEIVFGNVTPVSKIICNYF